MSSCLPYILQILLLSTGVFAYNDYDDSNGKLVYASPESLNYQAALFLNTKFICATTIILPSWVVTVAHFINHKPIPFFYKYTVKPLRMIKEKNPVTHDVMNIYIHPKFKNGFQYDIALIQLKKPFIFNDMISAIPINTVYNKPEVNDVVQVFLYESKDNKHNKKYICTTNATVNDPSKCQHYGIKGLENYIICGAYIKFDIRFLYMYRNTGGPVLYKGNLTGLVLSEYSEGNFPPNLLRKEIPSLYLRISQHLIWIHKIINSIK